MEYINCNLCGANDAKLLFTAKECLFGKRKFNIVQCNKCGLIYTNPRPTAEEINQYYPQEYSPFQFSYPDLLFPAENTWIRKFKNTLKKQILRIHYGYFSQNKPIHFFNNVLKFMTLPLKYGIGWIFPPYKKNGKVLDIGCSTGIYMAKLREIGWKTYGVEINQKAAKWGKEKLELDILAGTLELADFPAEYFDVITMWHSLEHMYSPADTLKEIRRILKKGGIIIIGIPNTETWETKFFGKYWWAWEVPRHLQHFSPKTIKLFLLKNSFKSIKIEYLPDINNIILSLQKFFLNIFPSKRNWITGFFDPDKNTRLRKSLKIVGYILMCLRQSGRVVIYAKK